LITDATLHRKESKELIANETEHYCHQTRTTDNGKTPHPSQNNNSGNVSHPLTSNALAEHDRQQHHPWADADRSSQARRQQSDSLRAAAQRLGVDLPETLLAKMSRTYDGLTPMERFARE